MDAIRAFVQTLLPFEFLQFDFMVNALLAILLLTPLLGLLGTMAVNQQMAFFSDALGHSALTGIGGRRAGAVHGRRIREVFVPAGRRRAGSTGQRFALSVDCACGGHCAVGGDVQFAAAVGHQPVPGAQPRHP